MKALFLVATLLSLTAQTATANQTFIKNDNHQVSVQISNVNNGVKFTLYKNVAIQSQMFQKELYSLDFLVPSTNPDCPPMTIEIRSSIEHKIRGTLANVTLNLGSTLKSELPETCEDLLNLEGEYTLEGF